MGAIIGRSMVFIEIEVLCWWRKEADACEGGRCDMPGVRRETYPRAERAGEGWGLEYVEVVNTALSFLENISLILVFIVGLWEERSGSVKWIVV
jgi:hypothetical protein